MRKVFFLAVFSFALFNLLPFEVPSDNIDSDSSYVLYDYDEPIHTYLVKLTEVPYFGGVFKNSAPEWIHVKNENAWWRGGWEFNDLLKANDAHFEDLFPDNNDDDDMGRWIIVTSRNDIKSRLLNNTRDVLTVEDGSAMFSICYFSQLSPLPYSNPFLVAGDKTWGIRIPKIQEGLDILKPTREILVGVVDTGCDLKHPALRDKLVQGRNFAGGNENDPSNRATFELHATHVTGTIVARKSCDGFFGIANGVAKVMPVRVLDEGGTGTVVNVSRGVAYAANNGCHVINMSLGSPHDSKALRDAVKDAIKKGVLVVCAMGNGNSDEPYFPAGYPGVIRVTATSLGNNGTESRAPFSNFGKTSTCAAPGHFTYSTLPNGKYGFLSGTSMASPHAAACAAVILSQGEFTPDQVRKIMETKGDVLKTDQPIGRRINLQNFLQKKSDEPTPMPDCIYNVEINYQYLKNLEKQNKIYLCEDPKTVPVDDKLFDPTRYLIEGLSLLSEMLVSR